ncbi:ribonuclease P protein component 1 [Salinigranum sp. GCM10025319]|uniref:ribonuclease P protein component 1 n=1 Tax=Salinigranum sp. GCM10025319 TaxID=3252687 RepID=UPI0036065321
MPLTPETLTRHELNGLHTEVVDSPNADLVGIAGRVVVETMRTLHIDCDAAEPRRTRDGDAVEHDDSRVRQVPKQGTTFEFRLPTDDGDDHGVPTADPSRRSRAHTNTRTDEAAEAAKASGTTSKPVSSPTQPATDVDSDSESIEADRVEAGEGVAYVTVDGTRLLSRPALRTENADAGESTWR